MNTQPNYTSLTDVTVEGANLIHEDNASSALRRPSPSNRSATLA